MMPPILPAVTDAALLETAEGSGVLISSVVAVELFSFGTVLACAVVTVGSGSGVVVEIFEGHESAFSSMCMITLRHDNVLIHSE